MKKINFKTLLNASILILGLHAGSSKADTYHVTMNDQDANLTSIIANAIMETKEARIFAKKVGFDKITAEIEDHGNDSTTTIHATGQYVIEGDEGCGELKITIVEKSTYSRGGSKLKYSATLDKSGIICELK